jgi:hypothetical protein
MALRSPPSGWATTSWEYRCKQTSSQIAAMRFPAGNLEPRGKFRVHLNPYVIDLIFSDIGGTMSSPNTTPPAASL